MCCWRNKQFCCSLRCPYVLLLVCLVCLLAILVQYNPFYSDSRLQISDNLSGSFYKMADGMVSDLSRWMRNLPEKVSTSTPLYSLVIPGSHDSATFDLDVAGGKANDFSSDLTLSNDKLKKWFKTQNLDFMEQLKFGIRYFDLRIIKHASGEIRFVHGLFSRKTVGYYLSQIKTFLEEHPKEIVLLDFNHIYDLKQDDHLPLCIEMNDIFNGMMVSRQKCEERGLNPSKMTLQQLWGIDGRVLVLYKNARYCQSLDSIWSRDDIDILWPYTTDEGQVVDNLLGQYKGLYRTDMLVVWHGILTPHADDDYAARMDRYKDLHEYVTPTTSAIVSWLRGRPNVPVNICCADFIEEHDFVKTVVAANL